MQHLHAQQSHTLALHVQAVLMQPLLLLFGDKGTLLVSQIASGLKWAGIALVATKTQVYAAEVVGSLAFLALPTISSLKSNAVGAHEQGALQGALSGVQSLASGIGPIVFWQLYRFCTVVVRAPRVRISVHISMPALNQTSCCLQRLCVVAAKLHRACQTLSAQAVHLQRYGSAMQIFPAGAAVLSCIPLVLSAALNVKKLQSWKELAAANSGDASLLEAAAPEPALSPPASPDASCRSEVRPLGSGSVASGAQDKGWPGGHEVMQEEGGWHHGSLDLGAGLMARGAELAHQREAAAAAASMSSQQRANGSHASHSSR